MNLNLYFSFTKIIILLEVYLHMQLDRVDRKILNELYNDSRLSMRELAKRVNLSAPSLQNVFVSSKVKALSKNTQSISIIKSRTCFRLYFRNHFKNGDTTRMQQFIQSYPSASFCYRVTGSLCYIVKFLFLHSLNLKNLLMMFLHMQRLFLISYYQKYLLLLILNISFQKIN